MLFPYFPIGERFRFLHEARDGLSAVLKVRRESSLEPEGFPLSLSAFRRQLPGAGDFILRIFLPSQGTHRRKSRADDMASVGPGLRFPGLTVLAEPDGNRAVEPQAPNQPPAQGSTLPVQGQKKRTAIQAGEALAKKGMHFSRLFSRHLDQPFGVLILQKPGNCLRKRRFFRQSQHGSPTFPSRCQDGSRSAYNRRL